MAAVAPGSSGRVRARNLLSSYYGVADSEGPGVSTAAADDDDMNIDSNAFAVDKYVGTLLQYKSLEELVQRGNAMVSEIKSLDSDMQMLVYENYNKFISATDTIRKMKTRVEEMESQMVELEKNMGTISAASEAVDSSLSARRGQLERLNGAKKNLTKLQFLTDLPARLQQCVREEKHVQAVRDFRRARRILTAVGQIGSFSGIQEEATLIMKRLAQTLKARLQEPHLAPSALGASTKLLLQLEGHESARLKEYLARRKRTLHEVLSSASPAATAAAAAGADAAGADADDADDADAPSAADAGEEDDDGLPKAASDVAQLGAAFVPQLIEMHNDWQELFMPGAPAPILLPPGERAEDPLPEELKEVMLLEAMQELCGGYIEMCRRRLQEEQVAPDQLLAGLHQLVKAVDALHQLLPQAKLMQRATRAAEQLAKRAMDAEVTALEQRLTSQVGALLGFEADAAAADAMHEQLRLAGSEITAHVRDALSATAPLIVPLCELLGLRADGMAKHLVTRLYGAVRAIPAAALAPTALASGVLVRAGLCLHMVSAGVLQVPAMLKSQLSPHGLGGAALGFDAAAMTREMQLAADQLLERFVEIQAQRLSLAVTERMEGTDWLQCAAPSEVTQVLDALLRELRAMQALAAHILPGEAPRPLLPQGPFPSASSAPQLVPQRSRQGTGASTAIQKDLQRMFARKISFSSGAFGGVGGVGGGGKASVTGMLTHVSKLTLKTLVEEIRLGTFSRHGFQQLQLDCAMLRWVLPCCVEDEGSVVALLDEALISCQERCLDPTPLDHPSLETLCEAKRSELRALFG